VNDDLGGIWKEVVMDYVKAISHHFPGESKENHEKIITVVLLIES
jgi:hypothetical protein